MEEILDTYDKNGNFVEKQTRSFCHSNKAKNFHKTVGVWIVNSKNEILAQKRAKFKLQEPNKWAMSVGGHISSGQTALQTCVRETEEELGLKTKESDFILLGEYVEEDSLEIGLVYLLNLDFLISKLKIDQQEVGEVKWFSYDNFVNLLYSDKFYNHTKQYRDWISKALKKYLFNKKVPDKKY